MASGSLAVTYGSMPVIVRDCAGRISVWTESAERLYGWRRDDAAGRVLHELLATKFPRPFAEIQAELFQRGVWHGELEQRQRHGQIVHVDGYWTLLRDEKGNPGSVIEICNDINELRRALEAKFWLEAIADTSHNAIINKTLDGVVKNWNTAAEKMFGYPADEIVGRSIKIIVPPDQFSKEDEILKAVREGHSIDNLETVRRRKDGVDIPVTVTIAPIRDANGTIIGTSSILHNISERRQRELRLQEMQSELTHISRFTELGQMVSAMAHEITQPLSAIRNYAAATRQFIRIDKVTQADSTLDKLDDEVRRAAVIIQRLRDFVKKGETKRRPEQVTQIVADARALALAGANAGEIMTDIHCDPDLAFVMVDRVQIQQVLFNLMRNAIEAMANSPRRQLSITAIGESAAVVEISVADTGPGLSASVKKDLFKPFVTTKENGMGIGLSICRSIVEAHGGRLWAEDVPTGGTVFRFTLQTTAKAA